MCLLNYLLTYVARQLKQQTSFGTVLVVLGCHVILTQSFKLVSFLHLYLLFNSRGYGTMSAILLLDGVMIGRLQ